MLRVPPTLTAPWGVWGLCRKKRLCPRPTSPFFLKALTTLVPPTEHLVCKALCSQLCVRLLRVPTKHTQRLPQSKCLIPVSTAFAPSSQAPLGGGGGLQKSQAWRAVSRGGPPAASPLARPGHRSTQPRAITIFFLKLWSQTHNMKMVIVTIFTRVVQGSTFTLLCHYHCHLSPELSSLQN